MAAIASVAYPRISSMVAVLGLALLASHEPPARHEHGVPWPDATAQVASADVPQAPPEGLGEVVSPPAFADARPWNHGGMVMGIPATPDPIARNALTDLLSGLFHALASLRV